jgi:hypothetical protein
MLGVRENKKGEFAWYISTLGVGYQEPGRTHGTSQSKCCGLDTKDRGGQDNSNLGPTPTHDACQMPQPQELE